MGLSPNRFPGHRISRGFDASARNPDGLGLIVDDNPMAMPVAPELWQVKAKRGAGYTECFVYEL